MQNTLKQIREDKGVTISELSRKTGISRQTIYNIEADLNANVSARVMGAIAAALDVKVSNIFLI